MQITLDVSEDIARQLGTSPEALSKARTRGSRDRSSLLRQANDRTGATDVRVCDAVRGGRLFEAAPSLLPFDPRGYRAGSGGGLGV